VTLGRSPVRRSGSGGGRRRDRRLGDGGRECVPRAWTDEINDAGGGGIGRWRWLYFKGVAGDSRGGAPTGG
jgi:hypothetical protein